MIADEILKDQILAASSDSRSLKDFMEAMMWCVCVCVCVCVHACVRACVCVLARERVCQREREHESDLVIALFA